MPIFYVSRRGGLHEPTWAEVLVDFILIGSIVGGFIIWINKDEKKEAEYNRQLKEKIEEYYEQQGTHYLTIGGGNHTIQTLLPESEDGMIQVPLYQGYKRIKIAQTDEGIVGIYVNNETIWCDVEEEDPVCRELGKTQRQMELIVNEEDIFGSDTRVFSRGTHILLVPIVNDGQHTYEQPEGYAITTEESLSVPGYITYFNIEEVVCIATRISESGKKEFCEFGTPTLEKPKVKTK